MRTTEQSMIVMIAECQNEEYLQKLAAESEAANKSFAPLMKRLYGTKSQPESSVSNDDEDYTKDLYVLDST